MKDVCKFESLKEGEISFLGWGSWAGGATKREKNKLGEWKSRLHGDSKVVWTSMNGNSDKKGQERFSSERRRVGIMGTGDEMTSLSMWHTN